MINLSNKIEKVYPEGWQEQTEIDLWTDQHEHGFQKVATF